MLGLIVAPISNIGTVLEEREPIPPSQLQRNGSQYSIRRTTEVFHFRSGSIKPNQEMLIYFQTVVK